MRKLLVINGPNLNLLGTREPEVYGTTTLADIEALVREHAVSRGIEVGFFQSNHEGALIDTVQQAAAVYEGIVFNPAAYTHYSYALRDAVAAIALPVVEVHLSDILSREDFRHVSVIAPVCIAQVKGRGPQGYLDALDLLLAHLDGDGTTGEATRHVD
jgi:3-dehydroquinate dehydratase-2